MRARACAAWLLAAAGLLAGPAQAEAPPLPLFADAPAVKAFCDRGLAEAAAGLRQLEAAPADAGWLARSDAFSASVEDLTAPVGFLVNVHPEAAVRDALQACEQRWQDFSSSLGLNERLYRALKALPAGDAVDTRARDLALEVFEDSGVTLPAARRPEAKRLADRIAVLGQAFDQAIRDNPTRVAFTADELRGVPETAWKDAPRERRGRVVLGLDMPSYLAVMNNAESAAARERMYRAKMNEGGPPNLKRLAEIVRLRARYAALFGFRSYDDFVMRRRMTGSTARTQDFLGEVARAVSTRERREVDELRAAKAEHLGRPLDGIRLDRWDVFFYTERLRRARYSVDQEAFRAYFPPQESVALVMAVAERLFGVRHERLDGVPLWHPDAQAWAVVDAATGERRATLLIDLYPREGKYNHAAVWPLRSGSSLTGRLPMAALVVNLDRRGLSLEEVETLLHEFGHALHNNLSRTRYTAQAGTSVPLDFVEAPSQMLEEWVYDARVLALMQQICRTCPPVPDALLAQARRARDYGKGVLYARQQLYASYDLALYGPKREDPLALWRRMEGATPVGHVPGTMLPAGFSHLASHYGAGYYAYLYSLAVAVDLRTAFAGDLLNADVGHRYRDHVLARGGERPPGELLHDFLGRDTDTRAFFDFLAREP